MPIIGDIGVPGLIIILIIALIVLGPGRLPEVGAALGRGIREFRSATDLSVAHTAAPTAAPTSATETPEQHIARLQEERDRLAAELAAAQSATATPHTDEGSNAS
jgi:sec-independent protein translocase protein TatA